MMHSHLVTLVVFSALVATVLLHAAPHEFKRPRDEHDEWKAADDHESDEHFGPTGQADLGEGRIGNLEQQPAGDEVSGRSLDDPVSQQALPPSMLRAAGCAGPKAPRWVKRGSTVLRPK